MKGPPDTHAALCLERAREPLGAAEALLSQGFLPDAVSRAYYATFHAASAALAMLRIFPRTHHGLRTEFIRHLVRPGLLEAEYGGILVAEQEDREESDYDVTTRPAEDVARERVEQARQFIARIEAFLSGHSKAGDLHGGAGEDGP